MVGCIDQVRCDYCHALIDSPVARTVLVTANRLRRGDAPGALRLIAGAPTGPRAIPAQDPAPTAGEGRVASQPITAWS